MFKDYIFELQYNCMKGNVGEKEMRCEIKKYSDYEFFLEVEKMLTKKLEYKENVEFYNKIKYKDFEQSILDRFSIITNQAKSLWIEESCREDVWKDQRILCKAEARCMNNLIRIHFWKNTFEKIDNQSIEEGYLGYVVLKLSSEYNLMPWVIVPNWKVLEYGYKKIIFTYERQVCVADEPIIIDTMPFYFQDNVFVRSAHTKILMFSLFGHYVYDFPQLSMPCMIKDSRCYPMIQEEISYFDMIRIFESNQISVQLYEVLGEKYDAGENDKYIETLEENLKKRMPVIIYRGSQVFLVVGYTDESEKQYIVYDDSGYFLPREKCSKGFINLIGKKELFSDSADIYMIMAA
mgnify:CR=1 FL=1